jgi:hypothetical protein
MECKDIVVVELAKHVLRIQRLISVSNLMLSKHQEDILLQLVATPILKENQLLRIVSSRVSSFDVVDLL